MVNFSLNLETLFSALIGRGRQRAAEQPPPPDGNMQPFTVRLTPATRAWYSAMARELAYPSEPAMLAHVLEAVRLASTGGSALCDTQSALRMMTDRVIHALQLHDLDAVRILAWLTPYGVTASSFRDADVLAQTLTDTVLDDLASRLGLERDWLAGKNERAAPRAAVWYKQPGSAARHITAMIKAGLRPEVHIVKREGAILDSAPSAENDPYEYVGVIVGTQEQGPDGRPFKKYERWDFQPWNYSRSRLHLKALVMWLTRVEKMHVGLSLTGWELPTPILDGVMNGRLLPVEAAEARRRLVWYPDDYVDTPETSVCAKDVHELEAVKTVYHDYHLDERLKELKETVAY